MYIEFNLQVYWIQIKSIWIQIKSKTLIWIQYIRVAKGDSIQWVTFLSRMKTLCNTRRFCVFRQKTQKERKRHRVLLKGKVARSSREVTFLSRTKTLSNTRRFLCFSSKISKGAKKRSCFVEGGLSKPNGAQATKLMPITTRSDVSKKRTYLPWGPFQRHLGRPTNGWSPLHEPHFWTAKEPNKMVPWWDGASEVLLRCIRGASEVLLRCIRGAFEVHPRCFWAAITKAPKWFGGDSEVIWRWFGGTSTPKFSKMICTVLIKDTDALHGSAPRTPPVSKHACFESRRY